MSRESGDDSLAVVVPELLSSHGLIREESLRFYK
jgi:hypothetical protein